jgi:hypothetical protein
VDAFAEKIDEWVDRCAERRLPIKGGDSPDMPTAPAPDDLRARRPDARGRPQPRTKAGRVSVRHYNKRRPHRALDLRAPDPRLTPSARGRPTASAMTHRRRDLLGGLIHEYEAAAA